MDLKQLKLFCIAVEKRGFSQAGEMLNLTQPAVSFQIGSLEQELGTKLFERRGGEMVVTKSGKTLYQYAQRMLQLAGEARQAIDELEGLARGELTIGASTIPGEYILPDLLCEFKRKYPGIGVNLIIADTKDVINKVIDGEVEVGVVGAREKNDKLVFTEFATEKLVLIAPANSEWFEQGIITLAELKEAPFVLRESGSGTRATMRQRLKEAGIGEKDFNIVMTVGSTAAAKKAVECGAGVSVVSERAVENETKLGLIKKIELEGLELRREFFTVYRRQKVYSPATAAFLQFLEERKGLYSR